MYQSYLCPVKWKMDEKPPYGNRKVSKLVSVKINDGADIYKWKNFYDKLADNSEEINLIWKQIDQIHDSKEDHVYYSKCKPCQFRKNTRNGEIGNKI